MSRVTPAWLGLRHDADARARDEGGAVLADALGRFLERRSTARGVRLLDVGAGTGAGAAWLHARLSLPQEWLLVDRDARLLALAAPVVEGWARAREAELTQLDDILSEEPVDAVTCQALLDILTLAQLHALLAPAVAQGAAVLTALTVTGRVWIAPAHPADDIVAAAFNAHQRREGLLGPDAAETAVALLRSEGYTVRHALTPWRLGADDARLLAEWLHGRAEAAQEQDPGAAALIRDWLEARLSAAAEGRLRAVVEHADFLALPPEYREAFGDAD